MKDFRKSEMHTPAALRYYLLQLLLLVLFLSGTARGATYYVATNGSDSNPGTQASPWLTMQNADTAAGGRVAGDCVNVAPGAYAGGIMPTHGGNLAAPTGYVVYRCQTLDGCIITASGGNADPAFNVASTGSGPNFLVLDGFELAANGSKSKDFGIISEAMDDVHNKSEDFG